MRRDKIRRDRITEILQERCKILQFELYEYSKVRLHPIINVQGFWDGTIEYMRDLEGIVVESEMIILKFGKSMDIGEKGYDDGGIYISGRWTMVDIIPKIK